MNIEKNKTVKVKTKSGYEYSYKYTDLAAIHEYLEENNIKYYQFIDSSENGDYIMTVVIENELESSPRRGCKVISASTTSNGNVAQDYGAILTYCRRYSLLMALGLATEDDDANRLNGTKTSEITTKEEAEKFIITFGKHKGLNLKEIQKENPSYLDYLLNYEKTDDVIKNYINLINENEEVTVATADTKEDIQKAIKLKNEFDKYLIETETDLEQILEHYGVSDSTDLSFEQITDAIKIMAKKIKPKEEKGVF